MYVASALGTALIAFAAISLDRRPSSRPAAVVDALRRAGQMSLTIYLAHALVFNLLVDWLDIVAATRARHRVDVRGDVLVHRDRPLAWRTNAGTDADPPNGSTDDSRA